jgi:sialic acid synthase SpsE/protoporphyrinogen oxidase
MVKKIYILGAGVTGLALAYELSKRDKEVEVIESSDSVGGLAKTLNWKGRPIDMGPHIYHTPHKDIEEYWLEEFEGLFFERDHWAKNYKNDNFYDYPISREFLNTLPIELKEKINLDLLRTNSKELSKANNYHDYIKALAGETLQELFFTKYPEKLWGMSTKKLDANWAPKRIQITEKRKPFYDGQWSAVGIEGSSSILRSLEEKILSLGAKINLEEEVNTIDIDDNSRISRIITSKRIIDLHPDDILINTTSCTVFSGLIGQKTNLKYRGVTLVMLETKKPTIFPEGVDFIYIDSEEVYFNRVSDQNSFIKDKFKEGTIICCEITYSPKDKIDLTKEKILAEEVKRQFSSLGFCDYSEITDYKVIKLPEVYPMFLMGYQQALADTKEKFDNIGNLYTLGSLAEFAYSDLQILFGKAIDLAEVITDQTFKTNKIDKTLPRLSFNKSVRIGDKVVGEGQRSFVIAEIGLNHNGDMGLAKKLIDEAINGGADAVKLQSYKSKNRVAKEGKTSRYVEKVLGTEETDFEMFEKNELSYEQTKELFEYSKGRTTIFSAPFDLESAEELESLGVDCYKIASFDIVNLPLIRKVASTGKPLIISTGMSYLSEVQDALFEVAKSGNRNVLLMQCTSSYPCPPESMNISAIDTMKRAFNDIPVGLSDHVVGDMVSLAAIARGADLVEKHFTLDKKMEGPDHVLSLEPQEFAEMIQRIRLVELSIGDGIKQPAPNEMSTIVRFRKSMYSNCKISKGSVISKDVITYTGPAFGIYARYEDVVLGRKATKDIEPYTPITWDLVGEISG